MGVDDAPYIADHPVFKVSKMINSILDEKKEKVGEHHKLYQTILTHLTCITYILFIPQRETVLL